VEIVGHGGFGFLGDGGDFERDGVADFCAGGVEPWLGDFEPVAELAVGFEGGLKWVAVEGAFDGCASASWQGVTGQFG